ncbi:Polynucleotide 5'-hydroxyl-kinase NOL9 [Chelonia mydas]|uniref:Polynucleotide 5'-hydroxyl-kinase NOL9 n=1 Tax=Chelonia mydas TaxID=8469 RepID=M7ASP2_CHEMY|nr:Polynucleotide 5'-hydroxyl-kinase NOL9 [Chelonia mydas]
MSGAAWYAIGMEMVGSGAVVVGTGLNGHLMAETAGDRCLGLQTEAAPLARDCCLGLPEQRLVWLSPGPPEELALDAAEVKEVAQRPPFTHQRMPRKMVYYGEASCDQDTERYIDTVKYVFNSYKKEVPLVINTMGWVKGVGLLLLIDMIRLLSPSHIVQISVEDFKDMPRFTPEYINLAAGLHTKGKLQGKCKSMDVSGMEDWKQYEGESGFQTSTTGHKLLCVQPKFPGAGNAGEARVHSSILRDVAMLGYLGQLQPLETRSVLPLNSLVPYQVPFNAVALRVIHTDVAPTHIMYSVNASWVGLCRILDEVRCQTDGPVLLTQTPVCDCLGFGIIRGIDMERKLYHILTPVPPENLRLVNCLLLGNITVPDCVFTNQECATGSRYGEQFTTLHRCKALGSTAVVPPATGARLWAARMFLYWKKRGAYELETLPTALRELEYGAVERFSWSSTLDITEDLGDDRTLTEDKVLRCQNPDCIDKRRALKVPSLKLLMELFDPM